MVKNFLTNYSNKGKKDTVSLELFTLLSSRNKPVSNKEASIKLFGNDQKNRIRVLKSRMKNKILDALTTEIVLENQQYDVNVKTSLLLRKKLTQAQTLFHSKKGNMKLLSSLLDDVINKAKEYELYRILTEGVNLKKQLVGFRKGMQEYELYEKQELEAIEIHHGLTKIINHYYKILLMYRSGNTSQKILLQYFANAIKDGEEILKKHHSKNIEHYLNIIKYANYDEQKKYKKAQKVMLDDVALLTNNKAVYRISRLGASYDYLCETSIRLGNYVEASNFAQEAKKCFKMGTLNYSVAQELEFRAMLYAGKLKEANKIIKDVTAQYKSEIDQHRISCHRFYLANYYFSKKNYNKCTSTLMKPFGFKSDRVGWEFNARILDIMASIEQGKIETAYNNHNSLIRYFNRNKAEKKSLSTRNKIILQLIGQWLKHGGNKSIAKMGGSELLAKLSLPKNEWDPLRSELIPFDSWLKNKA